ncbi:cystathionine beta-synthase [Nocardioides sp. TRM66260-LWL]|uniref:cystathionine beta-synthase n=1 Tax=Nocardioides sp. TRM66260-LWL TaxID=2874478 RepID=UPI001CC50A43|nr:cystathionine beta-synthase [Nocardioides sp. TRM66260-LWL]MBZ5736098.1 cystathionine beta-synthase [Nocardioides sp. TRM66260-LWL]
MDYVDSLLDLIGDTPLLRLGRTLDLPADTDPTGPLVLAKIEYLNPGGSVKDRIATRMIEAAEASGELQPGGTIVEPTSGNTGVGLAMVAQAKGYKCVFVCPDKVSEDKRNVLRAYGAEVVVCPTAVPPEHPDSYYNVSDRLASQPGAWKPNQYANPHNPRSHYETTGPEIWRQTEGRITHFVAGVGTGGTISGIGRYLKEQNPDVRIIGADPAGSVYSGGTGRPYLVEGVGEDFWPDTYDRGLPDRIIEVSDADSFAYTRRLAREEALLVGGSSGMAAFAARQLAHELAGTPEGRDAVIVVLLPDSGRGYLTKVFNDEWLAQYGFLTGAERDGRTVGEVLRGKSGGLPDLVHTHPAETIAEAVAILQEYGVSQMPVVRAEPPIVAAEVAGSVSERALLDALFAGHARLTDPVEDHMSGPLPTIGSNVPAQDAVTLLESADAVLVHEDGKPVGVLTRQDLLAFLAQG